MTRCDDDLGNAMLEFLYLAVLVMVPLVYVLLCAFEVQRAAFAVTEGARQASRAYATSADVPAAQDRAAAAGVLALADQGIDATPGLEIVCTGPCLGNGSTVTVTVRHTVTLPVLSILGPYAPSIPVSATHEETVDVLRAAP